MNKHHELNFDGRSRNTSPVDDFCEFLESIWMDNTEEEALELWERQVKQAPWLAEEALCSLDAIITAPPANLIELMQEHGWLGLYHRPDSATVVRFSFAEQLRWLKEMTERFRAVYRANKHHFQDKPRRIRPPFPPSQRADSLRQGRHLPKLVSVTTEKWVLS